MTIRKTGATETNWGTEIIFASTEKYCGKLLIFKEVSAKTAIQFHKENEKSWFVNEGSFVVRWIDTISGIAKENVVKQGDVVEVPQLRPFQVEALLPNSIIFEIGTAEYEKDTFKLSPEETTDLQPQEL